MARPMIAFCERYRTHMFADGECICCGFQESEATAADRAAARGLGVTCEGWTITQPTVKKPPVYVPPRRGRFAQWHDRNREWIYAWVPLWERVCGAWGVLRGTHYADRMDWR